MSSTVKIFYVHLLCVDCWIPIKWRIKADFQRARDKNFQLLEASDPIISCSQVNWFLWNAFFCNLDRSGLISSQVTVTGSFLKNGFHPTMKSNTTFPVLQNIGFDWFSFYCKYLSGKDQIIYWRSKGKLEKLLKPRTCLGEFLRKSIWSDSTMQYQQETISHSFCAYLLFFLEKQGKVLTTISIKSLS